MPLPHPLLYEINARCWLTGLSRAHGRPITLGKVPESEFDRWLALGFTHIWLMGVWSSGTGARDCAHTRFDARRYREALPDLASCDIGASPYAISRYEVPPELGGDSQLAAFRLRLNNRGMKLILDFVPNHLGIDHPWVTERPGLFVQSPALADGFFAAPGPAPFLAHGKDPNFAPWSDTVQLDYRRPQTRAAMQQLLLSVAARCDGVRCDMAMLLLNEVFRKTWQAFPSVDGDEHKEFWAEAISSVREQFPAFLFLAEVYWKLETALQALGFDYTYDKELYDRLVALDGPGVMRHLRSWSPDNLARCAHFIENHDERRAAAIWSFPQHQAAALLILALPGMRFLHEGQLEGAARQLPVQLIRRDAEPVNPQVAGFYQTVLSLLPKTAIGRGEFQLLEPRPATPNDPCAEHVIALRWHTSRDEFNLVVVNFSRQPASVRIPIDVSSTTDRKWRVTPLFGSHSKPQSNAPARLHSSLHLQDFEAVILRFTAADH